jgi:VWFA-related protein
MAMIGRTRRDAVRLSALTLLLAAAGPFAARSYGQAAQQPTFRSGVQVVEVDVRVFDKDGRFVGNLTRGDFELLENGEPQALQSLYIVRETSGPAAAVKGGEPPSPTGAAGPTEAPAESARQTWIFFFDLNHLTPSSGFDRARKMLEQFVAERFKDGDMGGVVAGNRMINNRLTSVKEELVSAVRSVRPLGDLRTRQMELREWPRILDENEAILIARGDQEALQRAVIRNGGGGNPFGRPGSLADAGVDLQLQEKARKIQRDIQKMTMESLAALNGLASGLARIPGPKTIVYFSEGFVITDMEATVRGVIGQAARAGGRFYTIDLRGLSRGLSTTDLDQMVAVDEAGPYNKFDPGEDATNYLASETGGLAIRNENNIGRALDTIARDSGRYYVLGYSPTNRNFDGKFRPIEVRVKRQGVRVRARRGYLAIEPAKMLLPRPADPKTGGAGKPAGGASDTARTDNLGTPAAAPDSGEPAAATAAGTIVAVPPSADAAGAMRMRPNADEALKALAGSNPASAGDFAKRGWDAYQRGDVESAAAAFTEAAKGPGVQPWVLYALGLSQLALARPADAAASWQRVREAAPDFANVYLDLADAYLQLTDLTKALAVLREAEKRWPKAEEIHNAIGVIHYRRGALDEAIAAFTRATEAAPGDSLAYYNLGRTYEMRFMRGRRYVSSQKEWVSPQGDLRKAEEHYERCVKLGGPYAEQAREGINRLQWSKK